MKYNKSYVYALPMVGESYLQFDKKNPINPKESILKNTYLKSEYMPDHNEHIFIKYKYIDRYRPFYQWLEVNDNFIDSYEDEDDDDIITYCYKIPIEHRENYHFFSESKYSLMDDQYKRHILKFHGLSLSSIVSQILYKDESLYIQREEELDCEPIDRNQEIGNLISIDKETHKMKKDLKPNNKQTVIWD